MNDRNLFFMHAYYEDRCLFIVLFRSLETYLISWTLNATQFDKGQRFTVLTNNTPTPYSYILFSLGFFDLLVAL